MKSLNPSAKFIGILIPTIILAFNYHPILNFVIFIVCMLVLFFSHVNLKVLGLILIPVIIMAIVLFSTGYNFPADSANQYILRIKTIEFTNAAVWNGLQLSGRVLAFAGFGLLFIMTTDRIKWIKSMEQQFHLPNMIAYGVLAAWGILPNMVLEYKKAKMAFRARGVKTFGISPALLKPLLVKSVRWSEAIAIAMESKGFTSGEQRTRYAKLKMNLADWTFPFLMTGLLVLGLIFL